MPNNNPNMLPLAIVIAGFVIAGAVLYKNDNKEDRVQFENKQVADAEQVAETSIPKSDFEESVIPSSGVTLPVIWGDLGIKLISVGAIDEARFKAIYEQRETFTDEYKNLLLGQNDERLKITPENAGYLLNLLWALGLASENPILDSGEMTNPRYGGAKNFASTGGWTIAQGDAMEHYSKHQFFNLTPEQQALVDKVSRGIYRPCCGNSVHFPDCNHGMAMLGLLELMASQGVSEPEMWKTALAVNSYWFPDTYLTIAKYLQDKGVQWKDANPQEVLSADYSSAQGYAKIAAKVSKPQQQRGSGGCDVGAVQPVVAPKTLKQKSGCGV